LVVCISCVILLISISTLHFSLLKYGEVKMSAYVLVGGAAVVR